MNTTTGQTADNVEQNAAVEAGGEAPYPGSRHMPQWEVGPLGTAPRFGWRQLPLLIGPGLVMGASAIGGGEWLTGPMNTARYGGAILWLATLSIVGQTLYNIEISRYALYTGEPIFTGKFRIKPGPVFWLPVYLLLDFGTFFPYLAAGAAVPLLTMWLGHLPEQADLETHKTLYKALPCTIFLAAMFPLLVGGKVYNSIKVVMATKLVVVLGFLAFLALFYSSFDTWREIISGFFKFGTVPVKNPSDPSATQNVFTSLLSGGGWPDIDFTTIGMLAAMAAIAGNGGLTNTPISNYTRDQGWGMGKEVGAIPSIIGGHTLHLSHVGKVFRLTVENLAKWKGWVRHISRDQLLVWMPACFVGLALPSMLSVEFLERGTVIPNKDLASVMTAGGVQEAVGEPYGRLFWYLTLVCGFLVLGTSMVSTVDGVLRRWVDVFWTAIPQLRRMDPRAIGRVYFVVLCVYATFGLTLLLAAEATALLKISTNIYNWALGFSCWHTIAVGTILLPKELRPSLLRRCGLFTAGLYFLCIACLSTAALTSDKDIAPLIERVKGLF